MLESDVEDCYSDFDPLSGRRIDFASRQVTLKAMQVEQQHAGAAIDVDRYAELLM